MSPDWQTIGGFMIAKGRSSRPGIILALLLLFFGIQFIKAGSAEEGLTAGIRIKFVHEDSVYLEIGSAAGLSEGQKFLVRREALGEDLQGAAAIGEIQIESVAATSAVGRILSSRVQIMPGDIAYLSTENLNELRSQSVLREARRYPQLASFTGGDPSEQEMRESVPKAPLPEVNRFRGRIGIDSSFLQIPGAGMRSAQFGFMLRLDATRLGSSYWKISGYHRGRIQTRTDSQNETLSDLINRTYHFSLNYDSPRRPWVAGIGRLYVPWASSLNTIDGFYLGMRLGKQTVGFFGGTNPDPTSWNYDSHRQMAGAFVNVERGSFDAVRVTSTSGIAVSRLRWQPDRQFAFFENGIFYKYHLSIYSNQEVDLLNGTQTSGKREVRLSRSYVTVRLQPHRMVSFDLSENYFRNVPTFDTRLIGTGLLDKYLFQGLSGGFRLALPSNLGVYGNTGRSSRTGDQKASWNYLAGISLGNILRSGLRLDYRYSRFDSSFGRGTYQTLTADRQVGEGLRFEIQAGQQSVSSAFSDQSRARFINGNVDWYFGARYFMGIGATAYRGQMQHYNQYFINLGYRFDNRREAK